MAGRWNIQEVPISFNLLDMPNMGGARVLQNTPDGYMVFVDRVSKNKPLYRAVVVTPEEGEKINDGSIKAYKYQVKNIEGLASAKNTAIQLLNQTLAISEALVKDEMTPRERLLRQRFKMGAKITKDVIFEVHEIGKEVIITAKGKNIPTHKFMGFSQLVDNYFVAINPFRHESFEVIDSPYLNMVRDFFIVQSYYFQDGGKFRGPTYTLSEIQIWFLNFDDEEWWNKMDVTKEVKQTLIHRKSKDPSNLTNEFIPFTYVNTHYRDRGNRSNPSNIVIVKGDPTTNIEHTLNIQHIYKNGYQVERSLPKATSSADSQKLHTHVLADFEKPQQLTDIDSFMWAPSDDQMANGKSVAILEPTESGANGSRGALQVNASVKPGFPFPWAGAAIGDFEPPIDGFDVSQYSHIVFDVKGTPGKYRVMAFSADVAGIPPSQNFTISEQWQPVTLPLDKFAGFNPKQFSGFAIVAGPGFGEFQFTLDNVRFE